MERTGFEVHETTVEGQPEEVWRLITNPPGTESIGQDDVLRPALLGDQARAYVNGVPVLCNMQVLLQGDLVRLFTPDGQMAYHYAGRVGATTEEGAGRLCAYTATPIFGPAVCCPNAGCTRVYRPDALKERDNKCFCGASLLVEAEWKPEPPAEVLL